MIGEDFAALVDRSVGGMGLSREDIREWCIHPGGKRILDAVHKSLAFTNDQLDDCYQVLRDYGNMSSPTILFVLKRIMRRLTGGQPDGVRRVFGAAFGPGLTMETFIASA